MKKFLLALAGFIFGVFTQFVGLIIGLQVSPALGTVLTFPSILVTLLYGQPLGGLPPEARLLGLGFAGLLGAALFLGIAALINRRRR